MTMQGIDTAQRTFIQRQPITMLIGEQWVEAASSKTFVNDDDKSVA